jgi:hypothetical protein
MSVLRMTSSDNIDVFPKICPSSSNILDRHDALTVFSDIPAQTFISLPSVLTGSTH